MYTFIQTMSLSTISLELLSSKVELTGYRLKDKILEGFLKELCIVAVPVLGPGLGPELDRQTDGQTDRRTDGQTNNYSYRQTDEPF